MVEHMNITRSICDVFGRRHMWQLASFGLTGLIAGATDYTVMIVMHTALALSPVKSALVGYTVGTVISYFLNKAKTFSSSRPHREAAWRFAAVAACGFTLTGVLMNLCTNVLHVQYLLGRLVVVGVIAMLNFGCHKYWTFARQAEIT